ncbi:alcohol dehydrogenase [Duganella sp. BJB488]|uniref:alcohol dehydrogenase catalytic domain-containing protein n=1 Tax=unclassified Duganella TaxID=2636909 RepID=UPI000E34D642|nr:MULTISPECIES: alcohol dehydrogenase catalytic domain-containing protein [unclassified Duganella]RFP09291.1 alcohol dehydrogenase [Duganella sp. BJB475]RFP13180.1 alcohol dehydrogenase [Duganella sp. BJB489]RFP17060.1 alcohol dehydrogenase [Duganella sp. BJB488]RFP25327.1 alcohol dehydrogenase [Duganella sp. BJB476]RFP31534.1 alcohol dehydrogenase [Duganella sp. BJB480]
MSKMMRAARMHEVGKPMEIERIPVPEVRPGDVLVKVKACGIVPNLGNVLSNWGTWFPHLPLPKLPAIFGLDPAGVIEAVGSQVIGFKPGDRVYVNPARYCGACRNCRAGETTACASYTFNGYFGFSRRSQRIYDDYPYGGLCEYMTAPQYSLVRIPGNMRFEQAARLGYLGTAYRALRTAGVGPGSTVLINGISGTLGLGGALFALALGARRILGTGRNVELLQRVKALAPDRIHVHALGKRPMRDWSDEVTEGEGVDAVIDALGPGADPRTLLDALSTLRRGGKLVNVGAVAGEVPVNLHYLMDNDITLVGSAWFTTAQGQEMADLAEAGVVDLSVFEHHSFPLEKVNEAIGGIEHRSGGFSNFVICP